MLSSVPEIIDPVFAKTSQYARFLLSENERFGLVFVKTGSINSGTGMKCYHLELVLSSETKCYHLGQKCYHLELMLSSGMKWYHLG